VAPTVSAFYRMAFGGGMLWLLLLVQRQWKGVTRRDVAWMLFPALAFAVDLVLWHRCIRDVGPGLATLLGNFQVFVMALAGVWNTNFLGCATHAVLPYSNALRLLPAYLQQLEMESNGKRVDRAGNVVSYATCPVVWGSEGTPSQHSFHQLLHQGTQSVPCDFIDISSNEILSANARAQADALAFGSQGGDYPGNRPSSTLYLEKFDATSLGRLLALYEHKVFVQGIIWNLNSFDQPGVELGKVMANKILSGGK
jgi:glucose-6-phosphate isomerase